MKPGDNVKILYGPSAGRLGTILMDIDGERTTFSVGFAGTTQTELVCAANLQLIPSPSPGDKVKEICWAFASSETSKLFGYSASGCYVLRHGVWPGPLEAVAGCGNTSPF